MLILERYRPLHPHNAKGRPALIGENDERNVETAGNQSRHPEPAVRGQSGWLRLRAGVPAAGQGHEHYAYRRAVARGRAWDRGAADEVRGGNRREAALEDR